MCTVAQGLMEKGRTEGNSEQFRKDVINSINMLKELNVEDKVVYLGEVSPGKEMNELYNLADATIFVSKYESFGLVCIESMAAGVHVILCSESLATFGEGSIVSSNENFEKDLEDIIFSDDESYNFYLITVQ